MKIIFSLLFLFFIKRSIADTDTFFEDKSNTKWDEVYERCLKVGHADISHSSRSRQKPGLLPFSMGVHHNIRMARMGVQKCFTLLLRITTKLKAKFLEPIDLNDIINIRSRNILGPHFESGTTFKLKPLIFWSNGRVPTDFEGKFSKDERDRMRCAIAFFHAFTCVRFVKRKPRDHNYLLLKKSSRGCMSEEIGRIQGGGSQTLNLEQHNYHCWDLGTIVHELMHVIGRFHEHSRMDRNDYINIHFNNIPIDEYFQYKTTQQLGYEHEDVGYYDYESIMHYPSDMGDKQVISALFKGDYDQQATNNDAMGQRNRPTKQDEIKINLLYKCNERSTTRSTTTTIARDGIGLSLSTVMTIEATSTITTETNSIDVCVVEDPCRNNGTCMSNGLTYICNCTIGWSGINCTQSDRSIKVILIGGAINRASSMEYYYPYQSQYNSLINVTMIKPRGHHTSVVMNGGKIMTMGGQYGVYLNNVEIFDPITNTSTKGLNMNKARYGCDSAIINGIVYVCGGHDGKTFLSSCESYQSGVWEYIAPMHKDRNNLRLISLNEYLYAIGGDDESGTNLNYVEKYNPKSNSWMMVKSMQTPRYDHGAAVLNGFIYVCGGWQTDSCERYDPALNKWSNIKKTIIDRGSGLSMVSDGHHLFAFGGREDDAYRSVEMYDPKKDKWILLKKH